MGKFATNKNGNIDSGTEVLANNMVFLQQTKEQDISNLYGDLFNEGILNINMGTSVNPIEPFELKQGTIAGKFSVGIGIAYKKDINTGMYKRIAILEESDYHNEPFEDVTYPDGRGVNQKTYTGVGTEYVDTPKSSGCININIPNIGIEYYVDLRYVNVCDNGNNGDGLNLTNYSIAKNLIPTSTDQRKRFYKWVDGYNIVLITDLAQQQGIIVGTVSKDVSNNLTFSSTGRSANLLIASEIIMEYFTNGAGITIVEEDGKQKLSVNVDNITTEIKDNKVKVTKDGLYPYTKFSMNSGPENIFGTNLTEVFLSLPDNFPLWITPAYNDRYSVYSTDSIESIDVWALVQTQFSSQAGTYTICINNTDKSNNNEVLEVPKLELMNKVRVGILAEITDANNYDILIDLSTQPYQTKWYDGSQWQIYHGVPLGEVTISGGVISTLKQFDYNTNFIESKITTGTRYISSQSAYNAKLSAVVTGNTPSSSIYPYALKMLDKNDELLGSLEYQVYQSGDYAIGLVAKKWNTNEFAARLQVGYNSSGVPVLQFNSNPIPRLPDYSALIQLYGQNSDPQTKTIPNDGWLLIRTMATNAYIGINNNIIIDDTWSVAVQEEVMLPIKAGDIINFRNTIVYFCPYR